MTTSYPRSVIIANTDNKASIRGSYCPTTTAWDSWNDLQWRANLTSIGKWTTPSPSDPEYERYWEVHMRRFAQTAYLVRIYAERALYRGSDDGLYYWVYPAPPRPDTDRYPTESLLGRRAEYWGAIDPAEMCSDDEWEYYIYMRPNVHIE